jgi:hypothetical protein
MPSNILLYTAEKISSEEMIKKAINIKAENISQENETRFTLTRSTQTIWFFLDSITLSELEEPSLSKVVELIGGVPQTCINIEIRRTGNGERLAAELANYFLQYYSGVLLGVTRSSYSRQDIGRMLITDSEPDFDG